LRPATIWVPRHRMWLFWVLLLVAALCLIGTVIVPGAAVITVVVLVTCLVGAPLAWRAGRGRRRDDDPTIIRNWRGEVTDLGYRDAERRIPRSQRAVFFGTPEWRRLENDRR
jgi:hypothetical protein